MCLNAAPGGPVEHGKKGKMISFTPLRAFCETEKRVSAGAQPQIARRTHEGHCRQCFATICFCNGGARSYAAAAGIGALRSGEQPGYAAKLNWSREQPKTRKSARAPVTK